MMEVRGRRRGFGVGRVIYERVFVLVEREYL